MTEPRELTELFRAARRVVNDAPHVRAPLFAVAAIGGAEVQDLLAHVGPSHLMPDDLLVGVQSVISFFLPFKPEVLAAARKDAPQVSRTWAEAYTTGNRAVDEVGLAVAEALLAQGHRVTVRPATGDFQPETLTGEWSHKSVAAFAGLGTFGRNQQIVTRAGCAGRLGTLLTTAVLPVHSPGLPRSCDALCGEEAPCRAACPIGAFAGVDGAFDRAACYARLRESAERFGDLPDAEVCGICALARCARL